MDRFNLCLAIGYCAFWFGFVLSMVGDMTSGPQLIKWWDAIWIPFVMGVFPILLGFLINYKRSWRDTLNHGIQNVGDKDTV